MRSVEELNQSTELFQGNVSSSEMENVHLLFFFNNVSEKEEGGGEDNRRFGTLLHGCVDLDFCCKVSDFGTSVDPSCLVSMLRVVKVV